MTPAASPVRHVEVVTHRASGRSTWHVVCVRDATGTTGLGECSDAGGDPVATVGALADLVVGRAATDRDGLRRAVTSARATAGAAALLWSTCWGGLEAALDDLGARQAGTPLGRWLGLPPAPSPRLYANLNRRFGAMGRAALIAAARAAVADGLPAVKIAPFDPWRGHRDATREGLTTVDAVLAVLSPGTGLMIDVHHSLSARDLPVVLPELAARGVWWVEDAVDVRDPAALESTAAISDVPLAAGEHEWDPDVAARACATGALRYWLVDPKHAGAAIGVRAVADAVAAGGVALTFHNPSGPVGTAYAAALGGLDPAPQWLEYAWGEPDRAAVLDPPEQVRDGRLVLGAGAGIGASLRAPAATSAAVR